MDRGRFLRRAFWVDAAVSAAVFVPMQLSGSWPGLAAGFLAGLGVAALALWCFGRAWAAAPDKGAAACWYGLRLFVLVGGVAVWLAVPGVSALGAILPQLAQAPVMAVLMAREDRREARAHGGAAAGRGIRGKEKASEAAATAQPVDRGGTKQNEKRGD